MLDKLFGEIYMYSENKAYEKAIELIGDKKVRQISVNHIEYLETIRNLDNATLSKIADKLEITKASVSTMIDKLIKQGYVKKAQSNEDKRIFYIELTDLGREVLDLEKNSFCQFGEELIQVLSEEDVKKLEEIMEKGLKLIKSSNK